MKTKLIGFISATALALAAATPALATQLAGSTTWDFYSLLNNQGFNGQTTGSSSDTFTQGGQSVYTLALSRLGTTNATTDCAGSWCASTLDLWAKNGGTPSEQGLGLSGDPNGAGGEIYYPNGIYVSTSQTNGPVSSFTLGSVQGTSTSGENWAILGYNFNTLNWDTLGSGTGGGVVTFSGSSLANYTSFIIAEPNANLVNGSNDIVLMSMTTVPEPGTLALLAFGLAAVGFAMSRRRKARTEA